MAKNNFVDPKDQSDAAEGVTDHSELAGMYRDVKKPELTHWMSEDERKKAMDKELNSIVTNLRKSAVLVGFCISLPVIVGLVIGQIAITKEIDRNNAMAYMFLIVLALGGFGALTYALFKWVGQTFHNHTVRALPITLTTLLSLFFLMQPVFRFTEIQIGGIAGYSAGLGILLAAGIFIATVSIFVWTSVKMPALLKLLILCVFFGGAVAVAYLT